MNDLQNLRKFPKFSLVDPCCKGFLLPWSFQHLFLTLNLPLPQVVLLFGILQSFLYSGRIIGQNIASSCCANVNKSFFAFLLGCSFSILGISSSIYILASCYFLIGVCCGAFKSRCDEEVANIVGYHRNNSLSTKSSITQITLIGFILSPLLGCLLFTSTPGNQFPALYACSLVALFFFIVALRPTETIKLLISLYYCLFNKKTKTLTSMDDKSYISNKGNGNKASESLINLEEIAKVEQLDITTLTPPPNFLTNCRNNVKDAQQMYHKTLLWRARNGIDHIIDTPQLFFDDILEFYPHAMQGRTIEGGAVCYEVLGKGKASELKRRGASPKDLLNHFTLRNEYIFNRCYKSYLDGKIGVEDATGVDADGAASEKVTKLMTILDVEGIKFSELTSDVISYIAMSGDVMDNHYPGQVIRLVICNSPYWFATAFSAVTRVLPESIKNKIVTIHSYDELDKFIDPSMRPVSYGGTGCALREGSDYKHFLEVSKKWKFASAQDSKDSASLPPLCSAVSTTPSSAASSAKTKTKTGVDTSVSAEAGVMGSIRRTASYQWVFGSKKDSPNSSSKGGKKTPGSQAFLGEKNSYRYDVESAQWVLDSSDMMEHLSARGSGDKSGGKNTAVVDVNEQTDLNGTAKKEKKTKKSKLKKSVSGGHSTPSNPILPQTETSLSSNHAYASMSNLTNMTHSSDVNGKLSVLKSPLRINVSGQQSVSATTTPKNTSTRLHPSSSNMTLEQIEEHGLVLAIQAAHHANQLSTRSNVSNGASGGLNSRNSSHENKTYDYFNALDHSIDSDYDSYGNANNDGLGAYTAQPHDSYDKGGGDSEGNYTLSDGHEIENSTRRYTRVVICTIIFVMHIMTVLMSSAVIIIIPLWMVLPYSVGGLEYNVKNIGVSVSLLGVILLFLLEYHVKQAKTSLQISPLRTLRICSGFLSALCCAMLWLYPSLIKPYLAPTSHVEDKSLSSSSSLIVSQITIVSHFWRQIVPVFLSCGIVFCLVLSRSSTTLLFEVALRHLAKTPTRMRRLISATNNIVVCVSPIFFCSVITYSINNRIGVPFNSLFIFYFISSFAMLLYILTLLFIIEFKGEFGTLKDDTFLYYMNRFNSHTDAKLGIFDATHTNYNNSTPTSFSTSGKLGDSDISSSISSNNNMNKLMLTLQDMITEFLFLLNIPKDDFKYFMKTIMNVQDSQTSSIFSIRLFNLKLNLIKES